MPLRKSELTSFDIVLFWIGTELIAVLVDMLLVKALQVDQLISSSIVIFAMTPLLFVMQKCSPLSFDKKLSLHSFLKYVVPLILLYTLLFSPLKSFWRFFERPEYYSEIISLHGWQKFAVIVQLTILAPLFEEIFYRGFIFRIIKERNNIVCGVWISTVLFVVSHGTLTDFGLYVSSLIFTYAYQKTGTIWGSILAHYLNNALLLITAHWRWG